MRWIILLCLVAVGVPHAARAQMRRVVDVAAIGQEVAKPDIIEQLRPLMNLELGFLKRVCDLTDEQKQEIATAAETSLQGMTDIVSANPRTGIADRKLAAIGANGQRLNENPHQRVQRDLADAIRPLLSKEQFAVYQTESKERDRFKRETAVGMTIELLDQHLSLADDQRERIHKQLLAKWDDVMNLSLETYASNRQFVPPVPYEFIQQELNGDQQRVWNLLNKHPFPLRLTQAAEAMWEEDFLE